MGCSKSQTKLIWLPWSPLIHMKLHVKYKKNVIRTFKVKGNKYVIILKNVYFLVLEINTFVTNHHMSIIMIINITRYNMSFPVTSWNRFCSSSSCLISSSSFFLFSSSRAVCSSSISFLNRKQSLLFLLSYNIQ